MTIYEVRVGKWEPMLFDDVTDALAMALDYQRDGKRVSVFRKNYQDGVRLGTTRLSVEGYASLVRRLERQCIGMALIKVVSVRRTNYEESETEVLPPTGIGKFCKGMPSVMMQYAAATCSEYKPSSELVIDDYGYVPHFYDVFYVRQVWASKGQFEPWELLYETPQADPKPHVMDY